MADKYEKTYNSYYWKERKDGLYKINGKKRGIDSLINNIKLCRNNEPLRILDVGCGEGHIIEYISHYVDNRSQFVGLDRNEQALDNASLILSNISQCSIVKREIVDSHWIDNMGVFDIVICINIFHEVYSSLLMQNDTNIDTDFSQIINRVFDLVDKGGLVLIFDGIEQAYSLFRPVIFEMRDQDTIDKFEVFVNEYLAFPMYFDRLSNNCIKCNLKDFTRFITKLRFISSHTWGVEKYESYQYYTETEYRYLFENNNMTIIDSSKFICDSHEWQKHIKILNDTPYPDECFYILGQKNDTKYEGSI